MTESEYAVRPNKTQLKKEIKALNHLGQELISLPPSALKKVPLSDNMLRAIEDGKRFQRGPLQRQLRRIASLMQYEDVDAIQLELARQKQPTKQQTAELHQLEQWRDRLIGGDEQLLTELIDQYPVIDRQHIRQLVRNAGAELKRNTTPKSARLLFKYLSEIKRTTPTDETDPPANPSA
ncbi:ribosome biogenesis factor YjgA [Arenicella xantha]|uniref:Dual-action ribosomal maturation protein DarP n=1 Tax=Arenicella xantha TaxID=644221 RepID=A0A395JJW5_9GAMM|nr:ribosome biogenesis factor YjgA [Arenicella xantha]RBP50809.1 ribosome-associated protein [Arenicella xantha]